MDLPQIERDKERTIKLIKFNVDPPSLWGVEEEFREIKKIQFQHVLINTI